MKAKNKIKIEILANYVKELEARLTTQIYVGGCLQAFIKEIGAFEEYNEKYRYFYAGKHFQDFKKTNLFQPWVEARKEQLIKEELERLEAKT